MRKPVLRTGMPQNHPKTSNRECPFEALTSSSRSSVQRITSIFPLRLNKLRTCQEAEDLGHRSLGQETLVLEAPKSTATWLVAQVAQQPPSLHAWP